MGTRMCTKQSHRNDWMFFELVAPLMGIVAAFYMNSASQKAALGAYLVGTVFSVLAGYYLRKLASGNTATVAWLNNRYHKWSVLALNGSMGVACLYYLWHHHEQAIVPLWVLANFFTLYMLSWALRLIRPHSFWAWFRSVLARVVLITAIAGIMWQPGYFVIPLLAVPFIAQAWYYLRREQKIHGWAER